MALTVLQIIQAFAGRQGLPQPTFVAGNYDAQVIQLLGLLQEFCDDLSVKRFWQSTTREALHTTLPQEDQGSIFTIAPFGYRGMVPGTFFNRTQRLEIPIAISPQEWQLRKTLSLTGPLFQARIRQDRLLLMPEPPAGHILAFEYQSEWFVTDNSGAGKKWPTADTDTFTVNDSLPVAYLRWAWKAAKGLDYAEDMDTYERMASQEKIAMNVPQTVHLDDTYRDARPGIVVPPGSWRL